MTTISKLEIDAVERKSDHIGAVTITRRLNGVGDLRFQLDNSAGIYDDLLSAEHQLVRLELGGSDFWYGHVHNVDSIGVDADDRWRKYVEVVAWDQAEELTFHDGYEKTYHPEGQTLDDILDDLFNVERLAGNIGRNDVIYTQGTSPDIEVGHFEKKEGTSLLGFLQELHRSVDCLFYVDDSGYFRSKSLGLIEDTGVTLDPSLLTGEVKFRRLSADKLYNWIKVVGKNPQFDSYTELNAGSWGSNFTPEDDLMDKRVGSASVKSTRTIGTTPPYLELDFSQAGGLFNYTALDLTKGEIGCWVKYRGASAQSPKAIRFQISDGSNTINFYSGSVSLAVTSQINRTQAYGGYWSWVTAPLGIQPDTNVIWCDHWWPMPLAGDFDWSHVESIRISYEQASAADYPDSFWVDGLTLPVPAVAIAEEGSYGTANERRELVTSRSDLRGQKALQRAADTLLAHHQDPQIDAMKGVFSGNTGLRYAGIKYTANFPMGIANLGFYASQLTHILAPYEDVGKGWDYVMEVEGVKIAERAYDHTRLGSGSFGYSVPGVGLKEK